MLTCTITNTSGADIAAGALPGVLNWNPLIANSGTFVVIMNVADLNKSVTPHSGFSLGEALQQLVQKGTITVGYANLGSTERDNVGDAIKNET